MEANNQNSNFWDWKKRKPNNVLMIEAGPSTGFFRRWCEYMQPIIKLTNKETDLIAALLKQRYELSKVISDPTILDSQLMSSEVKKKVLAETGITLSHFHVLISTLKKKKVITSTGIEPRLIPNIKVDDKGFFQFLLLFKFPEEDNK